MAEPTLTPRAVYRSILLDVAAARQLEPALLIGQTRRREVEAARAEVAKRLFGRGMSEQRIAQIMHRSLSVVQAYLDRQRYRPPTADPKQEGASS